MGVYNTRWSTKELLCAWILCWIPAGVLAFFALRGMDWRDPLDWVNYMLCTWLFAVALLLPVATWHPQPFGWFDQDGSSR